MPTRNRILAQHKDDKGRPLVILMRMSGGKVAHVFKRYKDMTKSDKDFIIGVHRRLMKSIPGSADDNIVGFLEFEENKPCG